MKIVVFDVDDTLYDQIDPFKKAMTEVFPEIMEVLEVSMSQLYLRFRYYSDKVFHLTENGTLPLEEMRVYRITEAMRDFSYVISTEQAQDFQESYQKNQGQIVLKKEMEDIITNLNENNITMLILTNGPTEHQKRKIKQLGLESFLDEKKVFISEEVGLAKPNREIFEHIENRFASSFPSDFIYVGDSYENDVMGAKGANWKCIWLNKYQKIIEKTTFQADVELTDYHKLDRVLASLLKK